MIFYYHFAQYVVKTLKVNKKVRNSYTATYLLLFCIYKIEIVMK